MGWLRAIAVVLAVWAVAAGVYYESGVRAWIRPPSPTAAELQKRQQDRVETLILGAGCAALGFWVLASLLDALKRTVSARSPARRAAPAYDPFTGTGGRA